MHNRYLSARINSDLSEKMVLLAGPRQVGKTTLALSLLANGSREHPAYFNWDDDHDRARIRKHELPTGEPLIILDEIHKFKPWRNLIKGLFDKRGANRSFLVTGSARLDHYRRGGDSLQGRYHFYRLHPFSIMELEANPDADTLSMLLKFGGFPEPLFSQNERAWRRWRHERHSRILRDDLRDLEHVREISQIEVLLSSLPERVGSPLSIRSLREDLGVAHDTVERWISILENLYVVFRIMPFGAPKIRAVKKEKKLYFWDWSEISNSGSRMENMVACQLLKYCHFLEDSEGYEMELRYLRDTDRREVDFVVIKDRKPVFAVECKSGEKSIGPAMEYFRQRTGIPVFYQVHLGTKDYEPGPGIRVLPWLQFCREMKMP